MPMSNRQLLSVVLSFRNEDGVISELVNRLGGALEPLGLDYELIFVNDASTDSSLQLLLEIAGRDPRVKIISMSRTFGVSQCVLAGMSYARGDAVVYMDADLQDPPEVIPELVKNWREGADVVYTTRLDRQGESLFKMWLTKWAYKILRSTSSDFSLPVDSGDFKLLSRRVVRELLQLTEKDPFLRGLVSWIGFKQVSVKYHRDARYAGSTHYPLISLNPWRAFIAGLASFSVMPLYLSLYFGMLISIGSFSYIIAIIVMFFLGWNIPGWSAIMVTVLFLGGVQLLVLGVLGIYLGRVSNEVKNRPNYIVESTIGFDDK